MQINVEVSKEAHELGQGLVKFASAVKLALADGWQVGQDIPVLITAAIAGLVPALQGADKIPLEIKEDLEAFIRGVGLSAIDLAFLFLKK